MSKNTIQAIAYTKEIEAINEILHLYDTYYIANAEVEQITNGNFKVATSKYQLTLRRNTFIQLVDQQDRYAVDECYSFTPFADFYKYINNERDSISTFQSSLSNIIHY